MTSVDRFLDRDVIYNVFHGDDVFGEISRAILLVPRIDEAAQLNGALEGFYADTFVLVLSVFSQPRLDAGRSPVIVNSFAGALLVATAGGATGHAEEERNGAQ